ncbi:Listeria/Bacterioides repeat-containing protein [Ruminococcus flavefaciens]|uniref:Listeria/Bacterioides repeat-containing protein n=1 Tax=Ruminococcus flavefaciens TaxID=1265 RepID=A0A1H6KL84_RUMFL|nr:DUF6273 domain-containing protein [Ruminococcus flavefaciens]SEH74478.1 Listeria/Bacterioides repeat-containing protein [Ruminococcus flavefaciens]
MKHTWKKAAAFVLATVLVVGIAPANVGTGGFFGQTGIVAHAASSTVTLNTNGGTINSGNITSYSEGTGAILPTDVTKEGYAFEGWFTNANFTGLPVTEISAEDTGDKTYYAKWTFYVRMGSYNGYDVDWFCVKTNTNGSMMMSKYVLKASRFGANGTYSTSDIHSWLDIDSGGTFATDLGLTASELALAKTIDSSSTYGDGTDQFTIPTLDGLDGLRSLYYTKAGVISNPSSIASIYWLRTMRDSGSARVVRSSMNTVSAGYSGATYGGRYIRPMFYLDETTMRSMIVGGSGTEDDPYILEQRYDISTNITPTNGGTVSATASRGGSEIYSGKLPNKMVAGANVTLTPSSAVGYNFKSINVNDGNVDVTDNLDGTYSFNMPDNAVTVNAVFEAIAFSNASVTLGDDLALNFYVDGIADDTAAAEYTVNFTGACVDESSALTYNAAVGKYYATTHVYAKDIDKDITATLCKGNDTVDTLENYSISQYLTAAESGADEKTSALITATKDFGNASSEYFYGTGSGYSDGFESYDPDTSAYAATFDSDAAKLSLVLDSKTAARLYVKGDESGTESTINSTKADYPTYHEVTGLLPQNLADEQTINVGGTDYKFSALSWCSRVLTNGSASQKNINMAKAIMAYYEAAKNYIAPANPYADKSLGDVVTFGNYDWYIIGKSDNGVTLLMQNNLMDKAYNDSYANVTWATCSLRTYLNETFYNNFSDEDKAKIVSTQNSNPDNLGYNTSGGNKTDDYIYLLSIAEANDLGDSIRNSGSGWWLRSPGELSKYAAYVDEYGGVITDGDNVDFEYGVRPALNLKF